jgi:hypothetical protein
MESGDALEAVCAFKAFKNLMFLIALVCLLVLEAAFWMNHCGLIDKKACPLSKGQLAGVCTEDSAVEGDMPLVMLAAQIEEATSGSDAHEGIIDRITRTAGGILTHIKNPTCRQVRCAMRISAGVGLVAMVLYCLGLLMSLKISIAGRLGGINHISRAFLLSLLALALAIPWQVCFPNVVAGAIFTWKELITRNVVTCQLCNCESFFYYGRFVGLWAVVVVLLLASQIRSCRWTKAVKRRFQILKP